MGVELDDNDDELTTWLLDVLLEYVLADEGTDDEELLASELDTALEATLLATLDCTELVAAELGAADEARIEDVLLTGALE